MKRLSVVLLALSFWVVRVVAAEPSCPEGEEHFRSIYQDPVPFEQAIKAAASVTPARVRLTGITVPHHLLAGHLIALGVRSASRFAYKRILLLSPDHFFESRRPFATTRRGFETVLGRIAGDRDAAGQLLQEQDLVEESCLFAAEHGVQALLPFLRDAFPQAELLPVAVSIKSSRRDWDRMAELLAPLVDPETLVVQSTDFSHYLPHKVARRYDQQTLNVIASGSLDAIASLVQPDHADSVGSLYIQMKLQRRLFGAEPVAVASENMQQYVKTPIEETTSYIVLLFGRSLDPPENPSNTAEHVYFFGGDTFFGRAMTPLLLDPDAAARIAEAVLAVTGSHPLIVNLEGVILPNVPEALEHMTLAMPEELAVPWLKRLKVAGVSLANNHAYDLGPEGYAETTRMLAAAGVPFFGQGETLSLPGLEVVALTDIGTNGTSAVDLITPDLLGRLSKEDAETPVAAFVHWGSEYEEAPGARESTLADAMRLSGASLIVGAHPHVAGDRLAALGGGEALMAYSLGNLLFDQTAERSSGALLEVRTFAQGTFFARLVPLPNLFDLGRAAVGTPSPQQP